jgi:hypothetical protein
MWRGVVLVVVLLAVFGGVAAWATTSDGARHHRTFHVGYGQTVLPDAAPGDRVLCPHNGGGGVPEPGHGVASGGAYVAGFKGTVDFSITARASGGVVVTRRRAGR